MINETLNTTATGIGGMPLSGEQFIVYAIVVGLIGLLPFILIYGRRLTGVVSYFGAYKLLKKMSSKTNNNIIVMAHMEAGLFGSMIMPSDIVKIEKALRKCNKKDVDFIIHTLGGDLFSSIKIATLIKNYEGKVRVFVPKHAMSGGTMIALGADEIYMGKDAVLGQVDPQVGSLFKVFSTKAWKEILKKKNVNKVSDDTIALSLIGKQATEEVYITLDKLLKNKIKNKDKRKKLIKFLADGDHNHGFQLDKEILKKYGLNIKDIEFSYPDEIIEKEPQKEVFFYKRKGDKNENN